MSPLAKCSNEMKNIYLVISFLYIIVSSIQAARLEGNISAHQRQDNFKPIPLPQTKSQELIRELSAKINAKQPDAKKQQQDYNMISLNTHETQAPSTISSFYNMMSRKPGDNTEHKNNERNQQQASSFQHFVDPQSQMYSQQLGLSGLRDAGGGGASRAGQTTELNTPLIYASGNNLQMSNPVDGPQIFDQTMTAAPATSSTGQDQIEGFYVNNVGNQPMLQEPTMAQELGPNNLAMANQLAMQGHYATQQNPTHQLGFGPKANYYSQEILQQPVSSYEVNKQAAYHMNLMHPNQQQHNKHSNKQTKPASTNKIKKKEMLSNEQLVTLINELKEFNSKQATKMSKGGKNQLKEFIKPTSGSNSDNERLFTEIVKSINKSKPASDDSKSNTDDEESDDDNQDGKGGDNNNRRSEDDEGDVSSEDLAKLAKRLVSGKRSRHQQTRRRSPSPARENDEVEDMRDALLDDKTTIKKHNKKEKDPIAHFKDKQQAEVDTRLENIMQEVANRKRKMDKKKKEEEQKEKDKEQVDDKQDDDADYADKARRRRDNPIASVESSQQASSKEVRTTVVEPRQSDQHQKGKKINRSMLEKGHKDNLAKALIKSEMSIDKKDGQDSSPQMKSSNNQLKQQANGMPPFQHLPHSDKLNRRSDEPMSNDSLFNSSDDRGEEKLKYPKQERNKDYESLKQSLTNARTSKSKLSSRIPVPVEKIVKKALNGEMEILADATPDAKLQPTGDGGTSISLKPPNAADNDSETQPIDESLNKNELVPVQGEPERGSEINAVEQGEKQLNDEYPISDQVSNRLNKLSHNLDRYFNDGFLQEVEQKAQPDGDKKQGAASHHHLQLATSVNDNGKEKPQGLRKDHDFDIDVAIDGKRDIPDPDEDGANMKINEEPENLIGKNKNKNKKRTKGEKVSNKKRDRRSKFNTKDLRTRKRKFDDLKLKTSKVNDPVENETLDSPIGPDGDDFPELGTAKRTRGSREKQTNYGRKIGDRFYQEPD